MSKAKDAVETMGTILPDDVGGRDAVHVAVVAVRAEQDLAPGEHVGKDGTVDNPLGIVDPFLTHEVKRGQRFWLYLYPRTITGLSHKWTHPAFDVEADAKKALESERWLREFVRTADCPDYNTLINAAVGDHHKNDAGDGGYTMSRLEDEYLFFGGSDAHGPIPPEFWDHVENVTGRKIPREGRAKYFSCSC